MNNLLAHLRDMTYLHNLLLKNAAKDCVTGIINRARSEERILLSPFNIHYHVSI